jgi:hypothetical protein
MAKLHELLAVAGDLEGTAKKSIEETTVTFAKKTENFISRTVVLQMFADDRQNENSTETKTLTETVLGKLDDVSRPVARWLNSFASVEASNQVATADLVVDDEILLQGVPSTALLGLESRLKLLHPMVEAIPTLQPGVDWVSDTQAGVGIYKNAEPRVRLKTEKQPGYKILVAATEHHPAQVEKWVQDVAVGKYTDTYQAATLSPAEKAELLNRLDTLIRAVKKARQRANAAEAVQSKLGDVVIDYLFPT